MPDLLCTLSVAPKCLSSPGTTELDVPLIEMYIVHALQCTVQVRSLRTLKVKSVRTSALCMTHVSFPKM